MGTVRQEHSGTGEKLRRFILLLDQSRRTQDRFALRPLLRRFGYNVCPAVSEREALEYIRVVVPSLIIVDTAQASAETFELIARMKQAPGCADVPAILVSAPVLRSEEEMAKRRVLMAHIRKPVQSDDLYRAVQRALERMPRQNIRIATCLKAVQGDVEGAEGYATELSERGMFFRTTVPQPVHAQLPVWIWTEDRQIQLDAKVIYRSLSDQGTFRGPGMGMMFVNIRPEDQTYLRTFIQKQLQDGMQDGGQ